MKMYKLIVFTIAANLNYLALFAQPQPDKLPYTSEVELMLFQGHIMMHHSKIGHLAKSRPRGFKLNYVKRTNGQQYWQSRYGYPDLGISFSYQNHRSHQLGHSLSVIPYIGFYMLRGKRSSIKLNMGTGLAYHTRPYHPTDNNLNLALGSALSAALYLSFQYQLEITPHLRTGLFVHMDHYSNGAFKKPNSGINLVQGGVSIAHKIQQGAEKKEWPKKLLKSRRLYLSFLPSISFKELGPGGRNTDPCYNLSVNLNKPLTQVSTLNVGLDGSYDLALKRWIAEEDLEDGQDHKTLAFTLGHELRVSYFAFITQLGYHLYRPDITLDFQDFFQRYGLRVYVSPKIALSGNLKTYFGKAEQIEWGLLFRL